tara:strand:- start:10760 stop:11227 length:468 start_codon:yes stop_codon:yes gene_type:complete
MAEFLIYYRAIFQYLAILGLFVYAFYRGGPPEKCASAILLGMVVLVVIYPIAFPQGGEYDSVEIGYFLIDLIAVLAFAALALKANRMYPLWLLAAQLISLMMHLTRDINVAMPGIVYFILMRAPSYILIVALAVGLYCHRKRIARYGSYRSWRIS